ALHTRDLDVANERKWAVVEAIKAELKRLKARSPDREKADEYRAWLRKARESESEWYEADGEEVNPQADAIEDSAYEEAGKIVERTGSEAKARDWLELATATAKTILELLDEWLAAPGNHYTPQTRQQHRHAVKAFCDTLPMHDGLP